MKFYNLDNKGLRKEIKKFRKTNYGKIVFCLSYAVSFLSFLISIFFIVFVNGCTYKYFCYRFLPITLIFLFVTFVSFILGSIYYYRELKKYVESKEK